MRHGLSVAGVLIAAYLLVFVAPQIATFGYDAYAYWAADPSAYGAIPIGALGFFGYAPPLAQLATLFHAVPWWVFDFLVTCLLFGTLAWMARRWTLAWLAFPPVLIELYHGNIHLLLAAAIVLGFRHPWTWSFVLLSKVTPGVGLIWFAIRREWRALGIALGVTGSHRRRFVARRPGRVVRRGWASSHRARRADCGTHCIPIPLVARLPVARSHRGRGRAHRPALDGAARGHAGPAGAVGGRALDAGRRSGGLADWSGRSAMQRDDAEAGRSG